MLGWSLNIDFAAGATGDPEGVGEGTYASEVRRNRYAYGYGYRYIQRLATMVVR